MPEPMWKPASEYRGRLMPDAQFWVSQERTEEEIQAQMNEICRFASKQVFPEDLVRYCLSSPHGHTCSSFKVKPFEDCLTFQDYAHRLTKF